MAVAYFGHKPDPLDADATGNPGPDVVIAPPVSMVTGDLVLVWLGYKTTSGVLTFTESVGGGQTWTRGTYNYGLTTSALMGQMSYCIYDGTWDANPDWDISSGGTSPMSGVMLVIRGADTTTPIDAAEARTANAAPSTPFTMSIAEITTATDGAMAIAHWFEADDTTMASLTSGWTHPNSETQWRNQSGADCSMGLAYKIVATAGGSGAVSVVQSVVTGDAWNSHMVAVRAAAGGASVVSHAYLHRIERGMITEHAAGQGGVLQE